MSLTVEYKTVLRNPQQLKGNWELPLQRCTSSGLFFPENLSWPSYATMSSSSLNLFLLLFLQIWIGRHTNFTLLNISSFRFVMHLYQRTSVILTHGSTQGVSQLPTLISGTSLNGISDASNNIISITFHTDDYQIGMWIFRTDNRSCQSCLAFSFSINENWHLKLTFIWGYSCWHLLLLIISHWFSYLLAPFGVPYL